MSVDYVYYDDYTPPENETDKNTTLPPMQLISNSQSILNLVLVVLNIIISIIGIGGNSLVIWICGWKMKRTVINTWYISLAVSDLVFCLFLPLQVFYMITSHWPFGLVFCKVTSSMLFLNMYSSVFLLVLISADRCLMVSFPVWSQNHRTVPKACGAVLLMWALSAVLTLPSLVFRQTVARGSVTQCFVAYSERSQHWAVALTRFVCGFLIPFLIIVFCGLVLVVKLRRMTLRSARPYRVMAALIVSFFCCWVPYHAFVLLESDLNNHNLDVLEAGLRVGGTLASANSFLSPVLYVFIGNDFKQTLKRSITSRMEAAMAEELRMGQSRSKSMEITRLELKPVSSTTGSI